MTRLLNGRRLFVAICGSFIDIFRKIDRDGKTIVAFKLLLQPDDMPENPTTESNFETDLIQIARNHLSRLQQRYRDNQCWRWKKKESHST